MSRSPRERHVAQRTCAGCGRRASKETLVRFVALDGTLRAGSRLAGRGAYTCPTESCFERARARRAFARILKTSVSVRERLADHYTDCDG